MFIQSATFLTRCKNLGASLDAFQLEPNGKGSVHNYLVKFRIA